MVDLQETPATPPVDEGGDERIGWIAAGIVLVVIGWGFAVVVNLFAHALAPSGGTTLFGVHLSSVMGAYAWGTLGLGLFTGALGVAVIVLGRSTARAPFVLPGYDYRDEPRTH
ncbi:MAG: hypothetical protein ACREBZ_00425 [Thermoplasmata archaeon]